MTSQHVRLIFSLVVAFVGINSILDQPQPSEYGMWLRILLVLIAALFTYVVSGIVDELEKQAEVRLRNNNRRW